MYTLILHFHSIDHLLRRHLTGRFNYLNKKCPWTVTRSGMQNCRSGERRKVSASLRKEREIRRGGVYCVANESQDDWFAYSCWVQTFTPFLFLLSSLSFSLPQINLSPSKLIYHSQLWQKMQNTYTVFLQNFSLTCVDFLSNLISSIWCFWHYLKYYISHKILSTFQLKFSIYLTIIKVWITFSNISGFLGP